MGGAGGIAEGLGEAVSFGALDDIVKSSVTRRSLLDFVKRVGAQALTEFTEESATEVMNILSDMAVMKDKAELVQYYAKYLAEHPGQESQALLATAASAAGQVLMSGAAGALSGGVMGGGATGMAYTGNYAANGNAADFPMPENDAIVQTLEEAEMPHRETVEQMIDRVVREQAQRDIDLPEGDASPPAGPEAARDIDLPVPETAKNRTEKDIDLPGAEAQKSTIIDVNPAKHTPAEQQRLDAYVGAVNEELAQQVRRFRENPDSMKKSFELAMVDARQAADLQKILPGFDTTGYRQVIQPNEMRHIENRHGPRGKADHSMTHPEDIARIEYVLENYDEVQPILTKDGEIKGTKMAHNADRSPAPTVQYKKILNGTYYIVEAVPDNQSKTLKIVSTYIGGFNKKSRCHMRKAPQGTRPGTSRLFRK
jgi:hypothetical protein